MPPTMVWRQAGERVMNCLEFRRRHTAVPTHTDTELQAHRQACEACEAFAASTDAFEQMLHAGLDARVAGCRDGEKASDADLQRRLGRALEVDVPDGLASRILRRQTLDKRRQHRRLWQGSLAVAAVLALSMGMSTLVLPPAANAGLVGELVAHIDQEPRALMTHVEVDRDRLAATLGALGLALDAPIGRVSYVALCPIGNHLGIHLVVAGENGPVTVIILPGDRQASAWGFDAHGHHGMVMPGLDGSIAVVGELGETLDPMARRIDGALRWRL